MSDVCVWRIPFIRESRCFDLSMNAFTHELNLKSTRSELLFPLAWIRQEMSLLTKEMISDPSRESDDAHLFISLSTNILLIENVSMMPSREILCVCSSISDGEYFNQCEIQFPLLHLKIRHSRSRDRWDSDEEQQCAMEHLSVFRCDNRFSPTRFIFVLDPSSVSERSNDEGKKLNKKNEHAELCVTFVCVFSPFRVSFRLLSLRSPRMKASRSQCDTNGELTLSTAETSSPWDA